MSGWMGDSLVMTTIVRTRAPAGLIKVVQVIQMLQVRLSYLATFELLQVRIKIINVIFVEPIAVFRPSGLESTKPQKSLAFKL